MKSTVKLISTLGSDLEIVRAARTTSGANADESPTAVRRLIRTLVRDKHTSPLEFAVLHFHIRCPLAIAVHFMRHRTASVNMFSQRYSELEGEDLEYHVPDVWRGQAKDNRQASDGVVNYGPIFFGTPGFYDSDTGKIIACHAEEAATLEYAKRIRGGVAREQARFVLPLGIATQFRFQINLHNLLHLLRLRTHEDAQLETREVALQMEALARPCFPYVFEAWDDYVKNAVTFSAAEIRLIAKYGLAPVVDANAPEIGMTKREVQDFNKKVAKFVGS